MRPSTCPHRVPAGTSALTFVAIAAVNVRRLVCQAPPARLEDEGSQSGTGSAVGTLDTGPARVGSRPPAWIEKEEMRSAD
eukprot:2952196-Prymnesium_polylepis.1